MAASGDFVPVQTRVKLLQLRKITPPPVLAREMIRLAGNDEVETDEIVKVVEKSPEMTTRILNWANSAYYGERYKIHTVKEGIIRVLGLSTAKSLLLAVSISSAFDFSKIPFFPLERHWFLAVSTGAIAKALTPKIRIPEKISQELAYTAGLIHNIGMLGLVQVFPREIKKVFVGGVDCSMNARVQECLGISPSLAGAWLGRRWGLPDDLVDTLEHHDDFSYQGENWPLVRLVGLSSKMAELYYEGCSLSEVREENCLEGFVSFADLSSAVDMMENRLGELKNFAQLLA